MTGSKWTVSKDRVTGNRWDVFDPSGEWEGYLPNWDDAINTATRCARLDQLRDWKHDHLCKADPYEGIRNMGRAIGEFAKVWQELREAFSEGVFEGAESNNEQVVEGTVFDSNEPPEGCTCMHFGGSCPECFGAVGYDDEAICPTCPLHREYRRYDLEDIPRYPREAA